MLYVFSYQIRCRCLLLLCWRNLTFCNNTYTYELHRQLAFCLTIIGALKKMFALMGYTNASIHSFPFPFHEVLVTLQSAWEKKKKSGVHAFRRCSAVSELIASCEPPQISPQGAQCQVHGTTIHYRWHRSSPRTITKFINTANFTILLEFPCPGGKIMHN